MVNQLFADPFLMDASFFLLGEALSSLSNSSSPTTRLNESLDLGKLPPKSVQPSKPNPSYKKISETTKKTESGSTRISKCIIILAVMFFSLLLVKYVNLRPSTLIENRILQLCADHPSKSSNEACAPLPERESLLAMYKAVRQILNDRSPCTLNTNGNEMVGTSISSDQLVQTLRTSSSFSMPDLEATFRVLMDIVLQNPECGIKFLNNDGVEWLKDAKNLPESFVLALDNPTLGWVCWLQFKAQVFVHYLCAVSVYVGYMLVLLLTYVSASSLYRWRRDAKLKEGQDIFEMVEQVINILATQHQVSSGVHLILESMLQDNLSTRPTKHSR